MSLKAKIEAVIYASEEPVTLVQLVGLLGVEGQAEIDRLDDRQGSLGLDAGEAGADWAPVEGQGDSEEGRPRINADERGEELVGGEDATAGAAASTLEDKQSEADGEEQATASSSAGSLDDKQVEAEVAGADGGGEPGVSGASERRAAREKERRLREFFRAIVEELIGEYARGDRGIEVREVAGGFRMGTKPEYHDAVRGFVRSLKPVLKLSLQALETLAVVAYKQPVTAPEVGEIRGVDSGGVLGSLLGRKLISTAGRKQVIGRPILYKTTKDFLLRFGLKDISELPSIEEFEKMAGDFIEQEEMQMPSGSDTTDERVTEENLLEEKNASEPQADGDSEDLNVDDSNRPSDEMPTLDGRESGLPPTYDKPGDDPSADEAAIQGDGDGR